MLPRLRFLHPIRDRRVISAMLLVCALASGLVISIPKTVVKDRSLPFPCMDCNCSCRDAQSCWSGCGCLTPAKKLAWAIAHGVRPPEWFERMVAAGGDDEQESSALACCAAKKPILACCGTANAAKPDDVCRHDDSQGCDTGRCDGESTVTVIPGIGKRRCDGIDRLYVLLSLVLPVERPTPTPVLLLSDRLGPVRSVSFQGSEVSRLDRPPRRVPA